MNEQQQLELKNELISLLYEEINAWETTEFQEEHDMVFTGKMQARKTEIEKLLGWR
jgi:hypothetical protein